MQNHIGYSERVPVLDARFASLDKLLSHGMRLNQEAFNRLNVNSELDVDDGSKEMDDISPQAVFIIKILNPDLSPHSHAGEKINENQVELGIHRPWKVWLEWIESLMMRMGTPQLIDRTVVMIPCFSLNKRKSWHFEESQREKYGDETQYSKIDKREDPFWLRDYHEALDYCKLDRGKKIVSLGCGRGDELSVIYDWFPEIASHMNLSGLDYSETALEKGRELIPEVDFRNWDLAKAYEGPKDIDLLISIATLQCSGFEGKSVFRSWFQNGLKAKGCVILGFPCCRYVDGQVISGPKVRNYRNPEWSLVLKDLAYYSRYLNSHKKRVMVTGRNTLFLTAIPILNGEVGLDVLS